MRVEILGSGGAVTIPRPGCRCHVCVEARERGIPYARSGPSVFVHGPDVLIDTPEESKDQLNRSQVTTIAAGLYSHWHPDHTAGRRVWESRNFAFRSLPPQVETTPLYIPETVWGDFERWYGLADQFRFLERQGTVRIVRVEENVPFPIGATSVTAIPLGAENTHAFLLETGLERILVAMDETHLWVPPALGRLDLVVLPVGVFEHHPFTGERLIPEEFCTPPVKKTRYEQTLEQLATLAPRRAVLLHVEEMERLSHDDLLRLGERDGWEIAWDGLVLEPLPHTTTDSAGTLASPVAPARRLSQRISEGDGIAILVRVADIDDARAAEEQGAKALAVDSLIDGIREATTLPLLWIGEGAPVEGVDAVVTAPDGDPWPEVENVVEVRDDDELEAALDEHDPEIFLIAPSRDRDTDAFESVLELLPDVPAGKLAIARLGGASRDEVVELERSGFDAVLVGSGDIAWLVGESVPEV